MTYARGVTVGCHHGPDFICWGCKVRPDGVAIGRSFTADRSWKFRSWQCAHRFSEHARCFGRARWWVVGPKGGVRAGYCRDHEHAVRVLSTAPGLRVFDEHRNQIEDFEAELTLLAFAGGRT